MTKLVCVSLIALPLAAAHSSLIKPKQPPLPPHQPPPQPPPQALPPPQQPPPQPPLPLLQAPAQPPPQQLLPFAPPKPSTGSMISPIGPLTGSFEDVV